MLSGACASLFQQTPDVILRKALTEASGVFDRGYPDIFVVKEAATGSTVHLCVGVDLELLYGHLVHPLNSQVVR